MTTQDVEKAVNEARAEEAAAKAVLLNAKEEYERFSKLYAERSVAERRFQDVTREHSTAQARAEAARAKAERTEVGRGQVEVAQPALDQRLRAREKAAEALRLAQLGDLEVEV